MGAQETNKFSFNNIIQNNSNDTSSNNYNYSKRMTSKSGLSFSAYSKNQESIQNKNNNETFPDCDINNSNLINISSNEYAPNEIYNSIFNKNASPSYTT